MKILHILMLSVIASHANSACRSVWVDDDYNTSTPAVRKQVCDSTLDIRAIEQPSIRPIQSPQVRPINSPTIPPIGTSSCRSESVYNGRKWVTQQVCS